MRFASRDYLPRKRELLDRHGLACYAVSTHLVGQAVCDPLDERHRNSLPEEVWGDGDPEGVRERASERMKDTARAAAAFGVDTVIGFTGSAIWHRLYAFPPPDWDVVDRGYEQFAERWSPIIDVFEQEGVRFALEVHPTEIAYDFVTTERTLDAIGRRPGFRLNFDPSHMVPQFLDSALFVEEFGDYIAHVHIKDSRRRLDGRRSLLGSHLNFGDPRRGWDFVSAGRGDVDFEALIRALGDRRLPRPAVDRVGGLGDGSRERRAGGTALHPRRRLRAVTADADGPTGSRSDRRLNALPH